MKIADLYSEILYVFTRYRNAHGTAPSRILVPFGWWCALADGGRGPVVEDGIRIAYTSIDCDFVPSNCVPIGICAGLSPEAEA